MRITTKNGKIFDFIINIEESALNSIMITDFDGKKERLLHENVEKIEIERYGKVSESVPPT